MSKKEKKIAIIGGGVGGIACIRMLKEEDFDPICFEKTDQIGGTWCYRKESFDGLGSTMPTTVMNNSKELGAFSNHPPKKEFNNYMRHDEIYQYILEIAEESDALRHIRLNKEVVNCKRAEDYDEKGRWSVTVKDTLTGEESTDVYDAVIMSVGFINRPKWVTYPFQETFKGRIIHTHSLKGVSSFQGQNVVVVGMGNSALDAADEISNVAKKVYLSTRSGAHVISRVGPHGYPIDYVLLRRWLTINLDILPAWLCSWIITKFVLDPIFDHSLYPVEPKYHLFAKDPVVNDHIGSKLLSGLVIQKKDVIRFTEDGVIFDDDINETKADVVIMATGYDWKYPFLEGDIVTQEKDFRINLYKNIWPPHLKHPTFAVHALLLPFGPGFPLGEIQCRWIAQVLADKCELPTEEEMVKDIKRKHEYNVKRYAPAELTTIRVDNIQYMDEIASIIGVKPNFIKMFFTDLKLFLKLWFGPAVPYQYRLDGPHKWEGARDAIMTVDERILYPFQKERLKQRNKETLFLV